MHSTVLIVPAEFLDDANRLGNALGYGPESYTVPLGNDGEVTHYGSHTWASDEFFLVVQGALSGSLPPVKWSEFGLTQTKVKKVLANLHISSPGSPLDPDGEQFGDPGTHFANETQSLGLSQT
jgi:hypothetical protein